MAFESHAACTGRPLDNCSPLALNRRPELSRSCHGGTYSKITRSVRVTVRSFYLEDQSQPDESHFVWAYRVKIENQGREPVQLLRRTWQITDARGRTQHVHGAGVVGEQPLLEPGESFEYTSGTPLDTPSGFMVGAYHMVVPSSGENFDVAIPAFSLDSPHQSGRVH